MFGDVIAFATMTDVDVIGPEPIHFFVHCLDKVVAGVAQDFEMFLESAAEAEDALSREAELDGLLQVATFHPQYRFEGESPATALTNMAPFPTLHLLREHDVSEAVDSYDGDTDVVWQRNMETVTREELPLRTLLRKIAAHRS